MLILKNRKFRRFRTNRSYKRQRKGQEPSTGEFLTSNSYCCAELLQLNLGTSGLDGLLKVLSLVLRQAFLNRCGSTVNEVLSFLQAKATSFLNGLHDLELSSTCRLQHDVERGLLLSGLSSTASGGASSYCNSCSSRLNSILILQDCCQLVNFLHSQVDQLLSNSFDICHFI